MTCKQTGEIGRFCYRRNGPTLGLLCRLKRDFLPSCSLVLYAIRLDFHDAVRGMDRNNAVYPQFRRFLNDPVHLFSLEKCLRKNQRWGASSRSLHGLDDSAFEYFRRHVRDLGSVTCAMVVCDEKGLSCTKSKAVAQMVQQGAGDSNGRRCDGVRRHKERGHSAAVEAMTVELFEERLHLVEEAVAILFH